MDRWCDKVAVVTGASSGIGEAVVKDLLKHGVIVIGIALADQIDRMKETQIKLPKNLQNNYYPIKCDVSNDDNVKEAFAWIENNVNGIDILVNCAGIYNQGLLTTTETSDHLKRTLEVNVMGIVYCTREAFKSMKNRNVDGHVVLINSIAGHNIIRFNGLSQTFNMYTPSKYAVTAMTEIYRQEFNDQNTKIKITSISPGLVDTGMVHEDLKKRNLPILKPEDISDAIIYVLGTPPHVQIHELTIKPVGEKE